MTLAYVLCLAAACYAWPSYGGLHDPSNCNPLAKDSHCPPNVAFAGKKSFNFEGASHNKDFEDFWIVDDQTKEDHDRLKFVGNGNGVEVSITEQKKAPTLTSHQYLFFGKVTVRAKAAKGTGLVTTIVLKSDSGDEIDWEMLGAFQNQAQSNYYYNGQPLFNTYNTTYAISSSSYDDFHDYTVEWTDKALTFSIDGAERRTWQPGEIPADKWPQTPMRVQLGLWAVGRRDDPGEISWAGGAVDWSGQPFAAAFHSVQVEDYAGWCEEVEDGRVEYQYDNKTKGWADVRVAGCRKRREPGVTAPPPSGTSSPSSSAGASPTESANAEPTDKGGEKPDDNEGAGAMLVPSAAWALMAGLGGMLFF
ncbi:cell wall glucanosyltransferase Mwg1 [Cordyceps fumosorosea ARSEF 2679]|uniref:Cell wall glucanosyltransferase Mwg1 n=1 Tax=Cordyceps fumosorosea (strain ARSEF 2679) TaxID=1081104 RepID=A0A162JNV2_CORFA|nr:cell wall glucanosyltransferase Mwg1 [Cordyceps fumosorosea ARSEF 2679]OAA71622.1 cell wall glucanosyltransferase Mwg1 [Cordyceps fumosorosea ARSEF 2679]